MLEPAPPDLPPDVVSLAATQTVGAAALASGAVWTWGRAFCGELGRGDSEEAPDAVAPPAAVPELAGVALVACGCQHVVAVARGGAAWAWGMNASGQLGLGRLSPAGVEPRPAPVAAPGPVAGAAAGLAHSLLLGAGASGTVWATRSDGALEPAMDNACAVAAGWTHSAAVERGSGRLFTWGCGLRNQLGHGAAESEASPRAVEALDELGQERPDGSRAPAVAAVACGAWHTAAVSGIGDVYAWGCVSESGLAPEPALLWEGEGADAAVDVACSSRGVAVLTAGGAVVCPLSGPTPVAKGVRVLGRGYGSFVWS